jgi:hypothetical protein
MNLKKRSLIFVTFFCSCLAISLLGASLGTKSWVTATCQRTINTDKSNGSVHFGLFEYQSILNAGLGDRVDNQHVLDILYVERTFFIYELYIATIATVCGGIFFGIISAMMAIVNTASNPIEAICHIPGLYLWNGIALFSSMSAVVTWIVQFYLRLRTNVMVRETRAQGLWSSEGMASFGFSFWMVVIAAVIFLANIFIILHATRDPYSIKRAKRLHPLPGKQAGDTMLY